MIEKDLQPDSSHIDNSSLLGINIEGDLRSKLGTVATWSKITAIGGFTNLGLNLLNLALKSGTSYVLAGSGILGALVVMVIGFFVNYFLLKFSLNLKKSLDEENQEAFNESTNFLRAYFRLIGILIVIAIIFIIIGTLLIIGSSL